MPNNQSNLLKFPTKKTAPKQYRTLQNANARINILSGSIRSGKTVAAIFWYLLKSYFNPNENGLYIICGKTLDTIERNILLPASQILPKENFNYSKAARYAHLKDSSKNINIKFYLIGANDEKSQSKVRGSTIFLAMIDELTEVPYSFFMMVDRGLSLPNSRVICTTNPDHPKHWVKKQYIDRAIDLDLFYERFSIYDNLFLDQKVIENLELNFTGVWKKRFILGEWVAAEGAIYGDSFNADIHIVDTKKYIDGCIDFYISVDYGINNPCVFLLFGVARDNTSFLITEYYWDSNKEEGSKQKYAMEYLKDLAEFIKKNLPTVKTIKKIIIDPSAKDFINLINSNEGRRVLNLKNRTAFPAKELAGGADNSVLSGIQLVVNQFNRNKFFIDKKADNTIAEFFSYMWDEKSNKDKPQKKNDHAMDAVRYFFSTLQKEKKKIELTFEKRQNYSIYR